MVSKVLVINKNSQIRGVVCAALERNGFVTVGVGSYPEAIEHLSWSPADLAISDGFTTDGVTGASLLHRLFPALRLLVLSGSVVCKLEIPFSSQQTRDPRALREQEVDHLWQGHSQYDGEE